MMSMEFSDRMAFFLTFHFIFHIVNPDIAINSNKRTWGISMAVFATGALTYSQACSYLFLFIERRNYDALDVYNVRLLSSRRHGA